MRLWKSWKIAAKDFGIFRRKKILLFSLVALPLALSTGLPAIIWLLIIRRAIPPATIIALLNAFSFFFVILASIIPIGLASYSIVGEKVEKSLEPLLATPTTDDELLMGKNIAAFLPSIAATYAGAAIFMVLVDATTHIQLGYLFFPNWTMAVILLLVAPLACIFSIETNVIISSRVSDIRAAGQLGGLAIIPFGAIYVLAEVRFITLNETNLLIISAVLFIADAVLFYLSRATFRREEILTKWK